MLEYWSPSEVTRPKLTIGVICLFFPSVDASGYVLAILLTRTVHVCDP